VKSAGRDSPILEYIKRTHGITSAEYRTIFPDAKLISDEHREKMRVTAKSRFLIDPTLRKKAASRTFDFVQNRDLRTLLQRDLKSAKTCLDNKLWKPSIILYGSIIEAVLIEINPGTQTFNEALEKAKTENLISDKEYHKIHLIRDLRNFVHLHKELKEKEEINDYWAKTFADICESIIRRFGN
jgi:hypothetical protein